MNELTIPIGVTIAIIGGAMSLLALVINVIISGQRERIIRQRKEFADALAACVAYEEFPYIVLRRRADAAQDERVRISSELSMIQRELAYYSAWLAIESSNVSKAFENLVAKLREVAGGKIHEAWLTPPIDSDDNMNMPDLGLNKLEPFKKLYLKEVTYHLSVIPRCLRRQSKESD